MPIPDHIMAASPAKASHDARPRSAYIHVPFCAHRCGYCNFTLVAGRDDLIEAYLEAIRREFSRLAAPAEMDTLFLGGGTPTRLPPAALARLLRLVLHWHPLAEGGEFSIEANPVDVSTECVSVLAEHGVTRMSLGAQSFQPQKLQVLERDHWPQQIRAAFFLAQARLRSVSLDLIFAAPGETLADWQDDLRQAIALEPDHVSTYGLTFEKGTSFWTRRVRGELASANETLEAAMYEAAIDRLTAAGFEHYEVSNFAAAGHRCRHNEVYWTGGSFFAYGPGAARYIDGRREVNHRSTTAYLKRMQAGLSPVAESETLSADDQARELFVFAMRRLEGVRRKWFRDQTGFALDQLCGERLKRPVELGLIADDGQRLSLTRRGLLVSDTLWSEYL